mmetsp:Transcript_56640/g.132914  ORF Transcript_56640/g.132914 Transcript_56640/m.132914 type:complete len:239 (-) Transcript_56640:1436-2152(-)
MTSPSSKTRMEKDAWSSWPHPVVLLERPPCDGCQSTKLCWHAFERRLFVHGGFLNIFQPPTALQEQPFRLMRKLVIGMRCRICEHLEHHDTQGKDISSRKPLLFAKRLRRYVARCAAKLVLINSTHGFVDTEVHHNNVRLMIVCVFEHQVGLLDITMHDCILMHENQGLKALFEESAPPILVHGRTRRLHAAAQHLEVSSFADIAHQVVRKVILEDLIHLGYSPAANKLHSSKLGQQG